MENLAVAVLYRLVSGPLDALIRVLLDLLRVHAHSLAGGFFSIDLGDEKALVVDELPEHDVPVGIVLEPHV